MSNDSRTSVKDAEYLSDPVTHEILENSLGRVYAKQILRAIQGRVLTQLEAAFPDNSRQLSALTKLTKQEFNKALDVVEALCRQSPSKNETGKVLLSYSGEDILVRNGMGSDYTTSYQTIVINHNNKKSQ